MPSPGDAIVAAINARSAVLFCGAGISIDPPATLPDWKTLRDETIRAVAGVDPALEFRLPGLLDQPLIGRSGGGLAPELVATIVRGVVPSYFQSLRVLDHDQPNANHRLIAELAKAGLITTIISTNFDQLIEKALDAAGVNFAVRRSDADFAAFSSAAVRERPIELLKLHGCISDPDTIVATVEQEAVGLSPEKGRVLAALWRDFVALFWGYSGADLKLDIDYLRMATAAPGARGFFWNLFANDSFREPPNEYVQDLVSRYDGRGLVCHETLGTLLGPLVAHLPDRPAPAGTAAELRAARGAQLAASLRAWADKAVRPAHAQEIFGRLYESSGGLEAAVDCYGRLAGTAQQEKRPALEALAFARGGELLASLGQWQPAVDVMRRADDLARTSGAIDIDLLEARSLALADTAQGYLLRSTQPRAFARLLSRWATPRVAADALIVELDTADFLLQQRQSAKALELYATVETRARAAGRLVTVVDVQSRRSRAYSALNRFDEAAAAARSGADLARALGRHMDAALLDLRVRLLHGTPPAADERLDFAATLKAAGAERIACELILDLCDLQWLPSDEVAPLLDRVDAYIAKGGDHLRVAQAVQRCKAFRAAGDTAKELETIAAVKPLLARAGSEASAVLLYQRLADLQQASARPAAEVLASLEAAAAIARRAFGLAPPLEERLASVRREVSGAAPPDFDAFIEEWRKTLPMVDELLRVVAAEAGIDPEADAGPALAARFGPDTRFSWLLWNTAVKCRQLRAAGRVEDAFNVANGSMAMAMKLGDHQIASVLQNDCGLSLMVLERPDIAVTVFSVAADSAERAADLEGAIDQLFNAARSLRDLKRFAEAVPYLNRAFPHVEARQDLARGMALSLETGETGKELGDDKGSLESFEHAQYLASTLASARHLEQAALRLAKLHWKLDAFEPSIAYRRQVVEGLRQRGEAAGAAPFALLIGNTYEEKLQRPDDALEYYRLAESLNETASVLDAADLRQRIERCERAGAATPLRCWTVLRRISESPARAERMAAQLAMAIDFNLWRFEPRSFGAWYERAFPGAIPYPHEGDPEIPIWRFALIHQLLALGRAAQDIHDHGEAMLTFGLADQASTLCGITHGSYLARKHMASLYEFLGEADSAAAERNAADTIREGLDAAAREFGARLALATRPIPDLTLRHIIVKGRMNYEFAGLL